MLSQEKLIYSHKLIHACAAFVVLHILGTKWVEVSFGHFTLTHQIKNLKDKIAYAGATKHQFFETSHERAKHQTGKIQVGERDEGNL